MLTVADRGIGIAAEDQDRIFGRFQRAVPTTHYGGLGLGLYITQHIVGVHGGEVDLQSAAGSGATFRVRLPRRPHSEAT
jgi:signal transduction histidine kinase